jgi:hypothetical protein
MPPSGDADRGCVQRAPFAFIAAVHRSRASPMSVEALFVVRKSYSHADPEKSRDD